MCEPVSLALATFALGATQSVMGFMAQSQQAQVGDAMARRETERYDRNVTASLAANREEKIALNRREVQERDALIEKQRITAVEAAKMRGKQAAATGESGVTGISIDNLLMDIERGPANDAVQREATYMNTVAQIRDEMTGADRRMETRVNSMRPGFNPTPAPSALGLVAGIGGAALGAAGTYERAEYYRKGKG